MRIVRYVTLYQLKAMMNVDQSDPMYDARFNQVVNEASSLIDHIVRPRYFHPRFINATYNASGLRLIRVHDLNDVVAWSVDGQAQSDIDDLELEPDDGPPYSLLALKDDSYLPHFGNYSRSSLRISGFYGYLKPLLPLALLGSTIDNAAVTLTSTAAIPHIELYAGRYLRIDDELMFIMAVSGNNTLVVTRGINGSIASGHSSGTLMSVWEAPDEIQLMARTISYRIMTIPASSGNYKEASGKEPFGGIITDTILRDLQGLAPAYGE